MFSRGIAEIVFIVRDVHKAAAFYRDVVGLVPQTEATDDWAWFWAGQPEVMQRIALHKGSLLFEEHSPFPAGERFGRIHYAFEVARNQLDEAVAHVRGCGVAVFRPTRFDWMSATSFYFYDLDGNLLEWWSPDV